MSLQHDEKPMTSVIVQEYRRCASQRVDVLRFQVPDELDCMPDHHHLETTANQCDNDSLPHLQNVDFCQLLPLDVFPWHLQHRPREPDNLHLTLGTLKVSTHHVFLCCPRPTASLALFFLCFSKAFGLLTYEDVLDVTASRVEAA